MKKSMILLMLGCIVFAQTDDTSDDEALLDELLQSSPPPEQQLSEDAAIELRADENESVPAVTYERIQTVSNQNSDVSFSQQPSVPQTQRSAKKRPPRASSYSPEMSEEARIQETPDIPDFSHKSHIEDIGAECVQCHQTLFAESVRGIKKGPSMKEICSQCHNGSDARSEVLAGFSDEKKYVKTEMPLFSHTTHNQYAEECVMCHSDIYKPLKKIETPPPMDRCMGCHNNRKANSECKVCHEHPEKLKPKNHTSRWVYRNGHGKKARTHTRACMDCHAEHECTACHGGQTTFSIHRPGYKYSHGMDARRRSVNCGFCHDATYSCAQCHERNR